MSDKKVGLFDLASRAMGPAVTEFLAGVANQTLPDCVACSGKAVPFKCVVCDCYVCQEHGYHSVSRREGICRQCVLEFMEGPYIDLSPWEVLGVPENATRGEIERAFRLAAKKCHPDRHGSKEKAAEFRKLQWAHEKALEGVGR